MSQFIAISENQTEKIGNAGINELSEIKGIWRHSLEIGLKFL